MAIAPIDTITNNSTDGSSASQNDVIDKNEFLLLLVTQLQNQDPLSPMDSAEFTSQTAQFASLEQLQGINENLGYLQQYQSALFDEHAVSFIGKTVRAADNSVDKTDGDSSGLHFELARDASEVYAYIYDATGDLVHEIHETGPFSEGEHSLTWDGTDAEGNQVPDDRYYFEVQAVDTNGNTFTGVPFYEGTVNSVNFWNGTAYLTAGNHDIALGDVIQVTESPEEENI